MASKPIPRPCPIDVDVSTFNALCLAQAAISFTRKHLPYGSANQLSDFNKQRTGEASNAESIPRIKALRDSIGEIISTSRASLGLDNGTFACGIASGLALYYRAGNCGEHSIVAFSFLCCLGFPGITIHRVNSTIMDHAFCLIEWPGGTDRVVCDAWPSAAQACRWSEFFAKPTTPGSSPSYEVLASHTITDKNMGFDLVGQAFQAIDPDQIKKLPPESLTKGFSAPEIESYIKKYLGNGVYDHPYTVTSTSQPYQDYSYADPANKGTATLLSTAATLGEEWSGKVLPVIEQVAGRLNPKMLNPSMRYTGTKG